MHPGMNIALHRNELRLLISDLDWRGSRRLRPVPLGIQLRHRVNVVRSLVVILDLEWLIYFHCGDVWNVLTPFLIVDHSLRCRGALITRRHVNDDIFESVSGTDADGFCHDRRGVLFGARRLLRHVDWFHFRRRARVADCPLDVTSSGGGGDEPSRLCGGGGGCEERDCDNGKVSFTHLGYFSEKG